LVAAGAAPRNMVEERAAAVAAARGRVAAIQQQLRVGGSGARNEEVEALQARVDAAQDVLALAEERLARLTLTAPIRATIINVHADPGEVVAPGSPVVSLADASHPYVDVFVPPNEVDAIETGEPMQVRTDALPHGLPARVEHIGRELEFTPSFLFSERERPVLVVRVRLRIEDPAHTLRSGVPAFARPVEGSGSSGS
jgi:HlyD family secretion protein